MTDIEIPVGKRTPMYRFFEIMPLVLSVTILLTPVILSIIEPVWAAAFIIIYVISWFVRAVGMAVRTVQGYSSMTNAQKVNWAARLKDLENPGESLDRESKKSWGYSQHRRNLLRIAKPDDKSPRPADIYNAVIIAMVNEGRDVLEPTIQYVLENDYDHKKHTILVIAYEGRGTKETEAMVRDLVKEYGDKFYHAVAIKHPSGLPNEVIGKGGNITWAGRELKNWLEKKTVDPNNVIVTTLDSDNRPHRSYFPYVTYEYIVNPERRYVAFQPIALFLNNIWDVPAPMRVLATGNSFWTIINSLRPHMLRNFASHSQGMQSVVDTDFWSVRTIVEDGHQFWRSYFRYDGNYDVVPIFVPIYQDAVLSDTTRKTLKAQFIQLRRWAYGASDIAYVATKGFRKGRTVPFFGLVARFLRLVDGHVSWASASIIIAYGAWAPLLINPEASRSIAAHQLPNLAGQLLTFAMIGIFITIFLSFKMLPPRPERYKRRRNLWMLLQWVMMPVISIAYGSAAALTAQTRLFTGRYLDKFDVTEKAVVKEDKSISV
jgi:cellulose synthase/poly-beta-1,6-N-acetylglucosamine synthase-like glycosyltransferase